LLFFNGKSKTERRVRISLKEEDSKRTPWKPTLVVLLGCARRARVRLVREATQPAGCTEAKHEGVRGGNHERRRKEKPLVLARAPRHLKSSLDLFDQYACRIKIEQNNSRNFDNKNLKFISTEEWKGTELIYSYLLGSTRCIETLGKFDMLTHLDR
jgi:hypothetical protein